MTDTTPTLSTDDDGQPTAASNAPAGGSAASAAPALSSAAIIAGMKATISALPEPTRTDLTDGLRYLELALEQEVDAAIVAYAHKIPLAGDMIGRSVANAFNTAVTNGLVAVIGPIAGQAG